RPRSEGLRAALRGHDEKRLHRAAGRVAEALFRHRPRRADRRRVNPAQGARRRLRALKYSATSSTPRVLKISFGDSPPLRATHVPLTSALYSRVECASGLMLNITPRSRAR